MFITKNTSPLATLGLASVDFGKSINIFTFLRSTLVALLVSPRQHHRVRRPNRKIAPVVDTRVTCVSSSNRLYIIIWKDIQPVLSMSHSANAGLRELSISITSSFLEWQMQIRVLQSIKRKDCPDSPRHLVMSYLQRDTTLNAAEDLKKPAWCFSSSIA